MRLLAAGLAGLVLAVGAAVPATAAPRRTTPATTPAAAATFDTTGAREARRVDSVPTPDLKWYSCYSWAQCATAKVPLDYDNPRGEQTEIALLRIRAKDREHRIGSLFVNPGGPGGSATTLALYAPGFLGSDLLDRFDIVGMDPRGIGSSDTVACFPDVRRQTKALKGMTGVAYPVGAKQTKAYLASVRKLARGCSTTGRPLSGSMSTAEVARDMDVMRRAVGDERLTYLGFSYGTVLGQYYANMFPDRVRAIAVDGVVNPRAWAGSDAMKGRLLDDRMDSAAGAEKALARILALCDAAGSRRCGFADGDPAARFRSIVARLRARPVTADGVQVTAPVFLTSVLSALYSPQAPAAVTGLAAEMWTLTTTRAGSTAHRAAAVRVRNRLAFFYDNSADAYSTVMCTDGRHPAKLADWPAKAAGAARSAPYFGALWAWASAPCARDAWTVRDEDAYTGPFNRTSRNPLLVVGSYWDPATNYHAAVSSAALNGNARLISSDNFGHTGYSTSACLDNAVDRYLIAKHLPAPGTVCHADRPFTTDLDQDALGRAATENLHRPATFPY